MAAMELSARCSLAAAARLADRRSARQQQARSRPVSAVSAEAADKAKASSSGNADPLMVRTIRGDKVERPPVWMMRQAGRYMKVYQDLCKKHTSFRRKVGILRPKVLTLRERSETAELVFEISMQPYRAFKPDGVIMFSDILTPLTGMGIPFDILEKQGPVVSSPIRTMEQLKAVRPLVPEESVAYAGQALGALKQELKGTGAAVLGFVGAPFTLATYIVEGGTTATYLNIKKMAFGQPQILHALLDKLTESVITYVRYQADCGADVVQIFDSWGCNMHPSDWDVFSGPYIKRIVTEVKKTHPTLPLILYASGSGGMLERMAATGVDVVSVDQSVDLTDARRRLGGKEQAVQGNMDPAWLYAEKEHIEQRVIDTVLKGGNYKHIMNLGHGVMPTTPEANVATFFETCRTVHERVKL